MNKKGDAKLGRVKKQTKAWVYNPKACPQRHTKIPKKMATDAEEVAANGDKMDAAATPRRLQGE